MSKIDAILAKQKALAEELENIEPTEPTDTVVNKILALAKA